MTIRRRRIWEAEPTHVRPAQVVRIAARTLYFRHVQVGVSPNAATHVPEFRDLVKAAHRHGLEVILDVAFNHIGAGDQSGPVIILRSKLAEPCHSEPGDFD